MSENEKPSGHFEKEWYDREFMEIRMNLVWTAGTQKGGKTLCRVTYEALEDVLADSDIDDPLTQFAEHRDSFAAAIDRKLKLGRFEADGSLLVTTSDMA